MSAPIPPDSEYIPSTNGPVVMPRPSLSSSLFHSPPVWFPPLFYLLLAALFLWRSLFAGDVFLPANLLYHIAPWSSQVSPEVTLPLWNPLRWDGIAQFYPWRLFAAETLRTGLLPLWNPYQFCGTPFVANSQSAVFYPPNLLFTLLPVMRAFAFSTLLHLTLCGWFTYLLLRRLRCVPLAALLGGVVYAFSAWQVAWLQLPTFLATSCWFPLLFLAIHRAFAPATPQGGREEGRGKREANHGGHGEIRGEDYLTTEDTERHGDNSNDAIKNQESRIKNPVTLPASLFPLPCIIGLMLLAGHLQIAFYGLLAGTFWTLALCVVRAREAGWSVAGRGLGVCALGLTFGLMLAAPQILPAIELSRMSHRVSKPTKEGYQAYTEYALPSSGLAALTLPDFFGNDYDRNNPYWGYYIKRLGDEAISLRHNAAETANYVGILTLLLSLLAVLRSVQNRSRAVWFFGGLALLAILMAFGTAVNALFYFGVPGFGQSGSPARCLVLWALALAALAAFGLDTLLRQPPSKREISIVFGLFALLFAAGLSFGARSVANPPPGGMPIPLLRAIFGRIGEDWIRLVIMTIGGLTLFSFVKNQKSYTLYPVAYLALILVAGDLFWTGIRLNPTARPEAVYPETDSLRYIRENLGHERIFPVNRRWNLYQPPPAVFPPNAAMVYGFRDVQGYDSLLTGQYKLFANEFARPNAAGGQDASPPEVGNMIFFQNPNAPQVPTLGATFALTLPPTSQDFDSGAAPTGERVRDTGDMAIYALPNALPRARLASSMGTENGTVVWQEDGPTRLSLQTNASVETRLDIADQYYPGWKAFVDGKPVAIARNPNTPVFRSLPVPAGQHTIVFRYEPVSFRLGLYLACLSLCLVTAGFVLSRRIPD